MIVRRRADVTEPLLALTFDDGPSDLTEPILDVLAAHRAFATFFVVGSHVAGREGTLERARADGHELGSHTYSHTPPSELDDDELRSELERGAAAVGADVTLVRPPYGVDAERFDRIAGRLGLGPTILWSIDPRDWEETDVGLIAGRVLAEAAPGEIVDLHDGWRPERATLGAVEELVPALAERGFALVTVSELLAR